MLARLLVTGLALWGVACTAAGSTRPSPARVGDGPPVAALLRPEPPGFPFAPARPGREPGRTDPTFLFDLGRRQPWAGVRMLTRAELGRAIADLTGTEADLAYLPEDERRFNLSNDGLSGGIRDVQHAAQLASIANDVAARADVNAVVGCVGAPRECSGEDLRRFLQHAFFKPVSVAEAARYLEIYRRARARGDAALAMRAVLQAVLTSPLFLYRTELGAGGSGQRPLLPHELGAKLSYFLWGRPPDRRLEESVFGDRLAAYRGEVERMLADPRAGPQIKRIFIEWLGLDTLELGMKKAAATLADDMQASMEKEVDLLLENLVIRRRRPLAEVLSSGETWLDRPLAELYGLGGAVKGAGFERVDLTHTERRGLLTTPLLLAAHAKASGRSPMKRGHFFISDLMCRDFPAAAGVAAMQNPGQEGKMTLRKRFETLEHDGDCSSCHQVLNAGFAFDRFDPVGRRYPDDVVGRDELRGSFDLRPFDVLTFSTPVEAALAFARHPATGECAVTQFYRYAQGRVVDQRDRETLKQLIAAFARDGQDVVKLMKDIALSASFRSASVP